MKQTTMRLFVIFQDDSPLPCPVSYELEFRIGGQTPMVYAFLTEEAAGRVLEELPGLLDLDSNRAATLHVREFRPW